MTKKVKHDCKLVYGSNPGVQQKTYFLKYSKICYSREPEIARL